MSTTTKESRSKTTFDKYSAVLQYGSDIALAVAMGSFATFLWVAPTTEGVSIFWKAVGIASAGGAGIWAGIAHERFTYAWKLATGPGQGGIGRVVSIIAMAIGICAVVAVIRFAEHQRTASTCERAESAKNSRIADHQLCKEYFARRTAIDERLFKIEEK